MTVYKDRKYKLRLIRPCTEANWKDHNGRWIVQSYHYHTGIPWSDEASPHYLTLRDAKVAIDKYG